MPTFDQSAGSLNFVFRRGDSLSEEIDFSIGMAGYAVTSQLVSVVSGSPVQAITTTLTDAAAGKVNVALTSTQTASLPVGTYNWELTTTAPGNVVRTYLMGFVEVTA